MPKYDVITVGSATVDVFVETNDEDVIDIKSRHSESVYTCFELGSKILINRLEFTTGGGGTNTAVSFARLGFRTAYLGNIGKDLNGDKILRMLKKNRIAFAGTQSEHKTDYSIILDSIRKDRTILTYRDASCYLLPSKINTASLDAEFFYFSSLVGKSFDCTRYVMELAKKRGAKTAFNPSLYEVKFGRKKLAPLLVMTDVLIFNKEEAMELLGLHERPKTEDMLEQVRALGPKVVIITDGPRGACCSDGIYHYTMIPLKVKIVETTGAGDAFASAFVAGLMKKHDIEFCMRLGTANAQSVIQHYGAKDTLLSWKNAVRETKFHRAKFSKHKI